MASRVSWVVTSGELVGIVDTADESQLSRPIEDEHVQRGRRPVGVRDLLIFAVVEVREIEKIIFAQNLISSSESLHVGVANFVGAGSPGDHWARWPPGRHFSVW